ncbi:hypothetical protein CLOM_g3989 [Closterium sp. NIES-68]|nr:hypothetical protein CLOM_g3989 [Closterium sp. NIES-68]GJP83220.1 hypothetical protein CLOP_g13402 [Closterium sp. NIES-67]
MASGGAKLLKTRAGVRSMQGLLSLDLVGVAEALLGSLSGCFSDMACDTSPLQSGRLLRACLATPSLPSASRAKLVDELLQAAAHVSYFCKSEQALEILCFGLSILPDDMLNARVDRVSSLLSSQAFHHLLTTLEYMRKTYYTDSTKTLGDFERNNNQIAEVTVGAAVPLEPEAFPEISKAKPANPPNQAISRAGSAVQEKRAAPAASFQVPPPKPDPVPPLQSLPSDFASGNSTAPFANVAAESSAAEADDASYGCCVVCKAQPATVLLLECSHVCSCAKCSPSLALCPVCKNPVSLSIELQPTSPPPAARAPLSSAREAEIARMPHGSSATTTSNVSGQWQTTNGQMSNAETQQPAAFSYGALNSGVSSSLFLSDPLNSWPSSYQPPLPQGDNSFQPSSQVIQRGSLALLPDSFQYLPAGSINQILGNSRQSGEFAVRPSQPHVFTQAAQLPDAFAPTDPAFLLPPRSLNPAASDWLQNDGHDGMGSVMNGQVRAPSVYQPPGLF